MILPNFFIIGAAKSGTTSLHGYLDAHPEVSMTSPKEPALLARAGWREELPRYESMFGSPGAPARGESSTRYTCFPLAQGIPERLRAACPDARLVYVVRDPIERVVSHYTHTYAMLREHGSLASALKDLDQPANPYVVQSRYATQLEQWREWHEAGRLLVVDQADLYGERERTVLEVLRFLDLDPARLPDVSAEANVNDERTMMAPATARLWMTASPLTRRLPGPVNRRMVRALSRRQVAKPTLDPELRERLAAELRGEADRFRSLTGRQFPTWSI